jgi:hypothetical protein
VIFGHGRDRRRTSLLALGALFGEERHRAERHLEACAACAADHASLRRTWSALGEDPAREAEPPVPVGALHARVVARLDEAAEPRGSGRAVRWGFFAAAAAVAVAAFTFWLAPPAGDHGAGGPAERVVAERSPGDVAVSDEAMARLERTLAREHAARYLSEAEAVLVHVTAAPRLCTRRGHGVEVGEETRRSRELLERRALLVEMDAPVLESARGLLEDVEGILREVASLDPCANARELEAIREDIGRRRLLMKIDLMTRELQG